MRYFILFLIWFISISVQAQANKVLVDNTEYITMSVPDASIIDYWQRKGRASIELISTLDLEIIKLRTKIDFSDYRYELCKEAKFEYQNMVYRNAQEVQRLSVELGKMRDDRDKFKERAHKRGEILWTIGGLATAGIVGFAILKL